MMQDPSASSGEPFARAARAAAELRARTGVDRHDLLVVLGSGWAHATDALPALAEVPMAEIPGHHAPSAQGHDGSFRSVAVGGSAVLIARGRLHLYEGYAPHTVAHGVRTAAAAGCRTVVLTNAAGTINRDWPVGSTVVIRDHINFTGASPLTGPPPPPPHPGRFADMTSIYSPELRGIVQAVGTRLPEGVYVGFAGPQFETPAEIEAARRWGGDLVGMSTVIEAIAATSGPRGARVVAGDEPGGGSR